MCTCEICVLLAALLEPLCMYLVNLSIKDASRHAEPVQALVSRGGASEGDSKCYVLTRFDAFVLIVTDTGQPTHGHADGYDGLGLGLNRYVKICMCYRSNSVYTRPGSAYIYAFIYKAQA